MGPIPKIAVYTPSSEMISKAYLRWLKENNKTIFDFVQIYKKNKKNKPFLRISSFNQEVIFGMFKLYELGMKVKSSNEKVEPYEVVGHGHIKYFGPEKIQIYGERPNIKHLEELFEGKEIIEESFYNEKSYIINLKNSSK